MPSERNNTISRRRYYRKFALAVAMAALVLLVPVPAFALNGTGPVRVTYIYSPLCSLCEHSGPVIRATVNDLKSSGFDVQYEECSMESGEGMDLMERFGLTAVPAVIVGDRAIRPDEFGSDTKKLEALLRGNINDAAHYRMPLALERKISKDPEKDTIRVTTCVSNRGDGPVYATVKGGLCEGVTVVSGDTAWRGVVMPGDRHYIAYEAEIGGGVRTLPPQTLTYSDSTGDHSVLGPETPVLILKKLSLATVFLAGVVAGINPCLIAVMAFISAMALSIKGRRLYIIFNLLAFCAGLLLVYLLLGIGFLGLMERLPSLAATLKAGIIVLLFALALFAFYEAYRVKKNADRPSLFKSFLDRYKPLYRRFSLAANFGLGGAFGLIKMPCVGGIYIAILGAIVESGEMRSGLPYLAIYNLGVVLPVLILGTLLALGLSPVKVDDFRKGHRFYLKMVTGLILAAMAAGFIFNII